MDNLRQEFSKNQEMKDNIKKFREEAKKLEESDALQQARRKYVRTFSSFPVLRCEFFLSGRICLQLDLFLFTRKLLRRKL